MHQRNPESKKSQRNVRAAEAEMANGNRGNAKVTEKGNRESAEITVMAAGVTEMAEKPEREKVQESPGK